MKYIYLLIPVMSIFNWGCSQGTPEKNQDEPPIPGPIPLKVDFTFTIEGSRAPSKVDFNITEPNGEYYEWDFGDGETSKLLNPQHTFTEGGTYEVKLTGQKEGKELSVTKQVEIKPAIKSLVISSLIIRKMPARNGSETWDHALQGTYPDVFFQFLDKNSGILYELENPQADLQQSQLPHEIGFNYTIDNLEDTYYFKFWDNDMFDKNDYIGGFDFKPSNLNMETNTFLFKDNNLEVEIKGNWQE